MAQRSAPRVRIRRVYDPRAADDGHRVLVDRLWPRGVSRARLAAEWLKAVAPSHALRRWYGHRASRWPGFLARYRAELTTPDAAAALERLRALARAKVGVTLLTATRETERSHAVALARVLAGRPSGRLSSPSKASRASGGRS